MKHVIRVQHPRNQTVINVPKRLAKMTKFEDMDLAKIWINEIGNLEIEVLNLDESKNRPPIINSDHKIDRA